MAMLVRQAPSGSDAPDPSASRYGPGEQDTSAWDPEGRFLVMPLPDVPTSVDSAVRETADQEEDREGTGLERGQRRAALPAICLHSASAPQVEFRLLQQWEGTVVCLPGATFSAALRDLTDPKRPRELATFDIAEVSQDDRELLAPGAVFYWALGYETSETGQRSRVSRMRFRRLPLWTRRDIASIERGARELDAQFGVDA